MECFCLYKFNMLYIGFVVYRCYSRYHISWYMDMVEIESFVTLCYCKSTL